MESDKYFFEGLTKTAEVSQEKVVELFTKNPPKSDKEFHRWATQQGYNEHRAEEAVYKLLGDFLSSGKSKGVNNNYPEDQIERGIKVELEHTGDKDVARKIVYDHLSEFSNYYNALEKMEEELKYEK